MTSRGAPLGVLAFLEGAVGDALQQLGVVGKGADVTPVDLVGLDVEVVVAECLEAREHRIDLGFLGDVGGEGCVAHVGLRCR